jgi:hypothetical protein
MAKYYPDIAKGAKGTFVSFVRFIFSKVYSSLCKQKRDLSSSFEGGSRRGVSPFFLSSFSSKKQIYSPALCPTKTNSPWTRNQSPAGYVFYLCLSFLEVDVSSDLERDSAFFAFESSSDERSKNRKIFAPVPLGRKSPDEEKLTKRTFSHARTLSLSFNL